MFFFSPFFQRYIEKKGVLGAKGGGGNALSDGEGGEERMEQKKNPSHSLFLPTLKINNLMQGKKGKLCVTKKPQQLGEVFFLRVQQQQHLCIVIT